MAHTWLGTRLFRDEPHHFVEYLGRVAERLPAQGTLLDLGCGKNDTFANLRGNGRVVWGTDFERHNALVDGKWFRPLEKIGVIPFADQSFDVVAATWVLEHVEQPATFLAEVRRVLRPGGMFLGHSISSRHYVTWIRRFLNFLPHRSIQWLVRKLYGRPSEDTHPTHYRMNSRTRLRRLACPSGFQVSRFRSYEDSGYFRFNRLLENSAALLDWILEKLFADAGRIYFTVELRREEPAENWIRQTRAA